MASDIKLSEFLVNAVGTSSSGVSTLATCETIQCLCLSCQRGECSTPCENSCQSTCEKGCQTCETACEIVAQSKPPSFSISADSTSITVSISKGSYSYFRIYWRLTSETNAEYEDTTRSSYTITGLSPNTSYTVNVGYSSDGVNYYNIGAQTITTEAVAKPDNWSWFISNGDASAAETEAALKALNGTIPGVSNFKHTVWNDLVYKVDAMRTAYGTTWRTGTSSPLTRDETLMSSSDRVLTADRFNSLKYQVGSLESTGIEDVSPNDRVMGWYFTTLTNKLNTILDGIT